MRTKMLFCAVILGGSFISCTGGVDTDRPEMDTVAERDLATCTKYSAHRFANCIAEAGKDIESVLIYEAMAARGDQASKEFLSNIDKQLDFDGYIKRSKQNVDEN